MNTVISKDGTTIAYDKVGQGEALILIGGAFSFRGYSGWIELIDLLSKHFTVINYDRRGRGDSGDTKPYAIEREIEDLNALIQAVGGSASVFGMSSGAVLALKAAGCGLNITKMVLYEPPFNVDPSGKFPPADFAQHINALVASDNRGGAVSYFMTKGMGAPSFVPLMMRIMPGVWKRLKAVAHTLPYDIALLDGNFYGESLAGADWAEINTPALVIGGEKSAESLRNASQATADILAKGQHRLLEGQSHNVSMKALAPVILDYLQ